MARIDDFTAKMMGGGARSNFFRVDITFPLFVQNSNIIGERAEYLCKGTTLPELTLGNIEVPHMGMNVSLPAYNRETFDWTITMYAEGDLASRSAFETWQNGIFSTDGGTALIDPLDYRVDLQVHMLNPNQEVMKSYVLYNCWVTRVGNITLDMASATEIPTYEVVFRVGYSKTSDVNLDV
jgi:hypothetical protein